MKKQKRNGREGEERRTRGKKIQREQKTEVMEDERE